MKPRARRVTIAAAVLGVGVIGLTVILNVGTVRDHVEAWHFQLTRETEPIVPSPSSKEQPAILAGTNYGKNSSGFTPDSLFQLLATNSGLPVLHDHQACTPTLGESSFSWPAWLCWWPQKPGPADYWNTARVEFVDATSDLAIDILRANGWRVLGQRFPRRAYVVLPGPRGGPHEAPGQVQQILQPRLWVGE